MKRYEVGKAIAYKDDQVLNDKLDLMEEELDIVIEQVYEEGGYIFAEGYEDKVIEPITYQRWIL